MNTHYAQRRYIPEYPSQKAQFCYGRQCRNCGEEICRPAEVMQRGMHLAVVCDRCWAQVMVLWKQGEVSLTGIARAFGVSRPTVQDRFNRQGLRTGTANQRVRLALRRQAQRDPLSYYAKISYYRQQRGGRNRLRREEEFASEGVSQSG